MYPVTCWWNFRYSSSNILPIISYSRLLWQTCIVVRLRAVDSKDERDLHVSVQRRQCSRFFVTALNWTRNLLMLILNRLLSLLSRLFFESSSVSLPFFSKCP
jgi:hypothetical protein